MISVAILAYNEEPRIRTAVEAVIEEAKKADNLPIDIIIVNDGSKDGTAREIAALEKEYPSIQSITHAKNMGFGQSFKDAIRVAKYERITLLPGDNAVSSYSTRNIFKFRNHADVVIAYTVNTESRTIPRYILSMMYSMAYALTFGLHVRYFQGTPVYPVSSLRKLDLYAKGYSIMPEIVVKLLRQGSTFVEIDGYLNNKNNVSSAIRLKSLLHEGSAFLRLAWEVLFWNRGLYRGKPTRIWPDKPQRS